MSKKNQGPLNPDEMSPEELMKFEIAQELGLGEKVLAGGWRALTSKESGRLGGVIARQRREARKQEQ